MAVKNTNYKDKNGTEIYEGDFVKLINMNQDPDTGKLFDEIRTVKYRRDKFYLEQINTFHPEFCPIGDIEQDLLQVIGKAKSSGNANTGSNYFSIDRSEYNK